MTAVRPPRFCEYQDVGKHQRLMDDVYKNQRYVYDFTRKFYLLGRDHLIEQLNAGPDDNILEVGCGTGRNLLKASKLFPGTQFYGIDISQEMLATAIYNASRTPLGNQCHFGQGDAAALDTFPLFKRTEFDAIFMSYTLSMIPPWEQALHEAFALLKPGGKLHIIDFGMQQGLPKWFRAILSRWLGLFHVAPRSDLPHALSALATREYADVSYHSLYKDYCWYAVLTRPA